MIAAVDRSARPISVRLAAAVYRRAMVALPRPSRRLLAADLDLHVDGRPVPETHPRAEPAGLEIVAPAPVLGQRGRRLHAAER